MGQKLSCFSKQSEGTMKIPKPRKPKVLPKRKINNEVIEATTVKDQAPESETVEKDVNHVQSAAPISDDTNDIQSRLVLLELAPSNFKPPEPLTTQSNTSGDTVQPKLDDTNFKIPLAISQASSSDNYVAQPVDLHAREIAKGIAKPATWTDLYWNLIVKNKLLNDQYKVRALFSWLCSIPVKQTPFVTTEELQRAVENGVPLAQEALKSKSKTLKPDSPEHVLNEMALGKATYIQAFESLCHYAHIPCVTIKGLAKGVDYNVGMTLTDTTEKSNEHNVNVTKLQHAWNAAYIDGKWALFDPMWAAQRLAVGLNTRQSQLSQSSQMEYETDMFYFNVDPAKFIYSHFPFDQSWQLLKPPVTLKQFETSVPLKAAFFRHGLGLLSHQECVIPVRNELVVKLAMPTSLVNTLQFTFSLKYEDPMYDSMNLSQHGIHEIFKKDSTVSFQFRFPKHGAYKLTLYAQRIGEKVFADICEYRIESKGIEDKRSPNDSLSTIMPFPPTSQSSYGPAEKAYELGIKTIPEDLEAKVKCKTGVLELKFTTKSPNYKLPRLTARLKSVVHETSVLTDCIIIRTVDVNEPTNLSSQKEGVIDQDIQGPCISMSIFFPTAGEYALEVYGAPADSDENTPYFLVWQFMIDAELGFKLSTPVRDHCSRTNLGPNDISWASLCLKPISHVDPLIHVPTQGLIEPQKTRSKSEIMQQYMANVVTKEGDTKEVNENLGMPADFNQLPNEEQDPESYDLKITFEKQSKQKLYILGQLVDITSKEEQDCTTFLLQKWEEPEVCNSNERLVYLIRIPKGNHFYKLHMYATPIDQNQIPQSLPLVFSYIIEAPARLMASETPYIGTKWGAFPEKLKQQQAVIKTK